MMLQHSKGYTFTDLYNFPVWLRRFILNEILLKLENESKAANGDINTPIVNTGTPYTPNI